MGLKTYKNYRLSKNMYRKVPFPIHVLKMYIQNAVFLTVFLSGTTDKM